MKGHKANWTLRRWWAPNLIVIFVLAVIVPQLFAQDILLSDFEETNYVWLPGGVWMATGDCFGPGPAQGTLTNQQAVSGYFGNGLVNTYLNGDAGTGRLTSPAFTIQRNYLKFLIGAGNHRGQTCLNLLVGGQIVRSAVGLGDREQLDWLQWNVSAFAGQTAQIQIVDSYTSGWGHLNVDQIIETDQSLSSVFVAQQHYLNLPVQLSAATQLVELITNGLVAREFNLGLAASNAVPDFFVFVDLTPFENQEVMVRINSKLATTNQLACFFQSNTISTTVPFYQEALRPVYHYTARRGWNNDVNGMVYANGQYHVCYQHNPYGCVWGNMSWGSTTSPDLLHWTELPDAIFPDNLGMEYSGSAVVDWNDSAGYGTNALLSFYCSAGGENRMSAGQPYTQSMAYSLDQGQTWTKYPDNPIIPNVEGNNRDPKVIWYAPGSKWVMALYLNNNDFGFFSSTNLINWTQTSTFTFPGVSECPEIFPLPLDGNTNNLKWIFWAGGGQYDVGQFDGSTFTPQYGPFHLNGGNDFYAAQTFNNIPASDGRRILMAWANTGNYPNMPFNGGLTFPIELSLNTSDGSPRMYANPVREISGLRTSTNFWAAQALPDGVNVMSGAAGEACELAAQFEPGTATNVTFTLGGTAVSYNSQSQQLSCEGITNNLSPSNGVITLRMLMDRGMLEIFGNNGLLYMSMATTPVAGSQPLSLVAGGNGAQLISLNLYPLGSAWPAAPPYISAQPALTSPVTVGGQVSFSVTASSTTLPISYQWYANGQPVAGATNTTLTVLSAASTNANYYVVVSNAGGAVTSSVAHVTVPSPYNIAYWRMEGQIEAPNNAGTPSYNGVADADTNLGQGIYTTGSLAAAMDDLITFNGLSGDPVTLSTNVAPATMFVNGHNAGNYSYNAEAISNVDGSLFFPQDQYGDEMDFTGAFSLELFFQTDGNRSGSGIMQLIAQGTDTGQTFRYGINLNESPGGGIRFKVANSNLAKTNLIDLTATNYADGQWHYLLAVCDPSGGTNGQMRLTVVNQDGSQANATNNLPAGFLPLPAQNNGNLFLGRNTYPVSANPGTLLGFIDEVQITAGVVPDNARIGRIPAIDNHIQIKGVTTATNGVSFQWAGAAADSFLVQWTPQLGTVWHTISIISSAGSSNNFVDTNPGRVNGATAFYRIVGQ